MWRGWHRKMRARQRLLIHREMMSADYGDVIFPIVSEVSNPRHGDSYTVCDPLFLKLEIRGRYYLEIRNILNGYTDWRDELLDETFMGEYHRIKGFIPDDGRKFRFGWLNVKAVRKVIKAWPGEPFDVLGHLTRNGLIERAGCREAKMELSK
jgi:hypothetical protein